MTHGSAVLFYMRIVVEDEPIVQTMNFSPSEIVRRQMKHAALFRKTVTPLLAAALLLPFLCQCRKPRLAKPQSTFDPTQISSSTSVWELLTGLGHETPGHRSGRDSPEWIEVGRELIESGKSTHPETGNPGERISAYFYCADCHNSVREDSNLANISDPTAKLNFAVANGIPLLQGSTFSGIVNRESWYNDASGEKFLSTPADDAARSDLATAIELCSRKGSRGRDPEQWEREAILAYFWSLQWTVADLGFTGADLAELKRRSLNPEEHETLIREIKSRYATASPATIGAPPEDAKAGYSVDREPDLETGKVIWEKSCLHCHGADGASEHYFGDKEKTWKDLSRMFSETSRKSIYDLIRIGTNPEEGKRPYMPGFTKERMSDAQIEDLRFFIETQANR